MDHEKVAASLAELGNSHRLSVFRCSAFWSKLAMMGLRPEISRRGWVFLLRRYHITLRAWPR